MAVDFVEKGSIDLVTVNEIAITRRLKMRQRRTGWGLSRCAVTVIALLLIWTATNALAQTVDDSDNVAPGDNPDATAQSDDET